MRPLVRCLLATLLLAGCAEAPTDSSSPTVVYAAVRAEVPFDDAWNATLLHDALEKAGAQVLYANDDGLSARLEDDASLQASAAAPRWFLMVSFERIAYFGSMAEVGPHAEAHRREVEPRLAALLETLSQAGVEPDGAVRWSPVTAQPTA